MKPSPSIEKMTLLPQFKEHGDVLVARQPTRTQTGRHGMHLVTPAHTFTYSALIVLAIITGFVGAVLLIKAIGLSDGKERAVAAGAGFMHLGIGVCSLAGSGAVCLHSYRKQKAQAELDKLISQPPLQATDLVLMY